MEIAQRKAMKTVCSNILSIMRTYLKSETNFDYFNENFLPTLSVIDDKDMQSLCEFQINSDWNDNFLNEMGPQEF